MNDEFSSPFGSYESDGSSRSCSTAPGSPISGPCTYTEMTASLGALFLNLVDEYSGQGNNPAQGFDGVDSPQRLYNRRGSLAHERQARDEAAADKYRAQLTEYLVRICEQSIKRTEPELAARSKVSESYLRNQLEKRTLPAPNELFKFPATQCNLTSQVAFGECTFCKMKGHTRAMYRSHVMRCPVTNKIICPILTASLCGFCRDRGASWLHLAESCPRRTV